MFHTQHCRFAWYRMSKFISKSPGKMGKKTSHSRLLNPDSRWGPLTTISGFIPSYTHLQPWLNRVCWGYNYLITRVPGPLLFRVVSKAQRREKIAGHYELSGDTMRAAKGLKVGFCWVKVFTSIWKNKFPQIIKYSISVKSRLVKYYNLARAMKNQHFEAENHPIENETHIQQHHFLFQNLTFRGCFIFWRSFKTVMYEETSKTSKTIWKFRQCVKFMKFFSKKKIIWKHKKIATKNKHSHLLR